MQDYGESDNVVRYLPAPARRGDLTWGGLERECRAGRASRVVVPAVQINAAWLGVRDGARLVPRQREIGAEDSELTEDSESRC